MSKLLRIAQSVLIVWGLVSLFAGLIWLLSHFGHSDPAMSEGGVGRTDKMTANDVRFILNTEPLNTAKPTNVVHSFESARAFTGDHTDAVAIQVGNLPHAEFQRFDNQLHSAWIRGDKVDDFIKSALTTGKIREWQPNESEVLTPDYFINPKTLVLHDGNVTSAELVYVNLRTQMVYYISFKF